MDKCPICGFECEHTPFQYWERIKCKNKDCYTYFVGETLGMGEKSDVRKRYNLIYEFLLKKRGLYNREFYYKFFYHPGYIRKEDDAPECINVADLMVAYPNTILNRIDRILMCLSIKYPNFGQVIDQQDNGAILFCESELNSDDYDKEVNATWTMLEEFGFFNKRTSSLTAKGWIKIDELKKEAQSKRQGFIAMSFDVNAKRIGEIFKQAIEESGFVAQRIDEKEHNNQIVPEIFYEIQNSKFMVVDVTYPNYGAYYEAGYAQALGKEVIVCCRKADFEKNKPHFDIAQKNMVLWENEDELRVKLKNRIRATCN